MTIIRLIKSNEQQMKIDAKLYRETRGQRHLVSLDYSHVLRLLRFLVTAE